MLVGGIRGGRGFVLELRSLFFWDVGVCYWVIDALCLAVSGISLPVVHCYIREEWVPQLHHYENLRMYFLWYLKFSVDRNSDYSLLNCNTVQFGRCFRGTTS